mmetsp:Transcript_23399/g.34541  ORF Transcript_23399/g.34541 Transcript_23399/m.34541 type:complete len:114 (+) Transcript_23399:40-381(+)
MKLRSLQLLLLISIQYMAKGLTLPSTTPGTTSRHSCVKLAMSETDDGEVIDTTKAEYGVSYIGGDPCGSKYNDDPFEAQVQKPGLPDDMKARIQALADKKKAEKKAATKNESS